MKATNFGFSIPVGATITGVEVTIERKRFREATDYSVRLVVGGSIVGDNKATTTLYTSLDVTEDHGGASDLWGLSLTPSDVNASNFGVVYSAVDTEEAGSSTLFCDWIGITVYYVE